MGAASGDGRAVLVLWDIDLTLIEARGAGRDAFAAAFHQVTGEPLREIPLMTGRTDPDIYATTTALNGIAQPPPFGVFATALAAAYLAEQDSLRSRGRVLPGVVEALAGLAADRDIRQSVLTGNIRDAARVKLETFGLADHLDLAVGAYGDDDPHRPALVAIAQERATARYGTEFDRRNTVLVGDSPRDVEAARVGGARIIAVTAGGTSPAELAGADLVLADLTDTDGLLDAVRALAS